MVIIFSEEKDLSTSLTMEWLAKLGISVTRFNVESQNLDPSLFISNEGSEIMDNSIPKSDPSIVWYRRGYISNWQNYSYDKGLLRETRAKIREHLRGEFKDYRSACYGLLGNFNIDKPDKYSANKLEILSWASLLGMNVPKTLVTCSKKDVIEKFDISRGLICKPITDLLVLEYKNIQRSHKIKYLKSQQIECLPDTFGLTCFQEFIDKKYEVRTFRFFDLSFSIANFSCSNEYSKIDGRNLLDENGNINRIVPFRLPLTLKQKTKELLKWVGIQSGSFDFIVDRCGKFYFLEVNPVGQFGYVSNLGNYHIEKQIAKKITDLNNEFRTR